jgi:hypothetical protein
MPRPNHDLPSHLIGGVKDYAREQNIDVDEAHAQLLGYALQKARVIECAEDVVENVPDLDSEESSGD